jgi:hypothetical protein
MPPDFDRADTIRSYWGNPKTRTLAELPDRLRGRFGRWSSSCCGRRAVSVARAEDWEHWPIPAKMSRFWRGPTTWKPRRQAKKEALTG